MKRFFELPHITVLVPVAMLLALATSGATCDDGPYEQEIKTSEGEITIALSDVHNICMEDGDETGELCLPAFELYPFADTVEIESKSGDRFTASCPSDQPDCMTHLSCVYCFEADYGYYDENLTGPLECNISASLYTGGNADACNNEFTVYAENSDGEWGTLTFYNLYDYGDDEWGW